jgi:hypothetical protein
MNTLFRNRSLVMLSSCRCYGLSGWGSGRHLNVGNAMGFLAKVDKNGGAPTLLATNVNNPETVIVDATTVYWCDQGSISKVDKAGGAVTVVATSQSLPQALTSLSS